MFLRAQNFPYKILQYLMNSTARKIVCEFEGDIETAVSVLDIVDLADHEAGEPFA